MTRTTGFTLIKKIAATFVMVLGFGLQCNSASATYVTQLNETFQSGAAFSGTLTFNDSLTNLSAVSGVLSGGGYDTTTFDWVWWGGTGGLSQLLPGSSSTYADWMMSTSGTMFIEVDWVGGVTPLLLDSSLGSFTANVPGNAVIYADQMVTYNTGIAPVPEPGTMALLGLGMAGLAFYGKRRQKKA